MLKAVIFDLEGVIINTEKSVWDKAAGEFLNNHSRVYRREDIKHLIMGSTIEEGSAVFKKIYGLEESIEAIVSERRELVKKLFREKVDFIPGFEDFYASVVKKYKIAVATSLERNYLNDLDQHLKLNRLFSGHVYSISDIGYISKPNPDIFLYASRRLEVDPSECIVIEDSPFGVLAAKNAKMQCIALTTSVPRDLLRRADYIVDRYSEIDFL